MRLEFDLYAVSAPETWEHLLNITIALVCTVAAVFLFRKNPDPAATRERLSRRFLSLLLFFLAASAAWGEVRAIAHADQRAVANWIDDKNYEVVSGPIAQLNLKEKFWRSDPIPDFAVGESWFEYGDYSRNRRLHKHSEGGPLMEGREVSIWHREGLILRLYAKVEGRE